MTVPATIVPPELEACGGRRLLHPSVKSVSSTGVPGAGGVIVTLKVLPVSSQSLLASDR